MLIQQIERQWLIANKLTPEADQNLSTFPTLLRQIMFNRGLATVDECKRFLDALPLDGNDPFKLKNMALAVDRLARAIRGGENIIVYGDYDADGVTATALLLSTIRALGGRAEPYIPDRFDEGYGLNIGALRTLQEGGADVVVSVDCGVRSLKEASEARQIGLDLIITDHHTPGPDLPDAFALINPKQAGDEYPEKQLAGVGVAFKLSSALQQTMGNASPDGAGLDLVALGTVADMVPLTGENRWMVREGLARLRKPIRQGVLSLIGVSGLKPTRVRSGDIGYLLGPRLNAAGRLETAKNALNLLMTSDVFEAGRLAQYLDSQNRERQVLTQQMTATAEEMVIAAPGDGLLLVAIHADFNPGVVGLVASRLVERFYRPAIVGQRGAEFTRCSCRSIPEFHITRALETCADLFQNFGGHAAAAGFTVRNENLAAALERLQALARDQLGTLELKPVLHADAEIPLVELKPELLTDLEMVEPTGFGNPQVSLVSRGLMVRDARAVGQEAKHLKLTVTDGRITYDAIAFRHGHWLPTLPKVVDLLYRFETNEFNGRTSLQLNVRDLKPSI